MDEGKSKRNLLKGRTTGAPVSDESKITGLVTLAAELRKWLQYAEFYGGGSLRA